jgi:UPF0755 protein
LIRLIHKLFRYALIALIVAIIWLVYFAFTPLHFKNDGLNLDIESGYRFKSVSQRLVKAKVLLEPYSFEMLAKIIGEAGDLKAGSYIIESGITPLKLIDQITSGTGHQLGVTFIEGWTFEQIRETLKENESLKHMTMSETDQQILKDIGASETNPEGLFFPDTYYYSPNTSDRDILKRAYQTMQKKLDKLWQDRANDLPYKTPYEALIMASIIEKETGKSSERPMISGVFLNRLRIGMRLQTDPTVIYGMGSRFDGDIRKKDLSNDTPYNTYTRDGLPPTPIAMPGKASIEAALHPAKTNALYFVGKGDGSHVFSETLAQHNAAVMHYQLGDKSAR